MPAGDLKAAFDVAKHGVEAIEDDGFLADFEAAVAMAASVAVPDFLASASAVDPLSVADNFAPIATEAQTPVFQQVSFDILDQMRSDAPDNADAATLSHASSGGSFLQGPGGYVLQGVQGSPADSRQPVTERPIYSPASPDTSTWITTPVHQVYDLPSVPQIPQSAPGQDLQLNQAIRDAVGPYDASTFDLGPPQSIADVLAGTDWMPPPAISPPIQDRPSTFSQVMSGNYANAVLQNQLLNQGATPGSFVSPVVPYDSLFNPNATNLVDATLLASHGPNLELQRAQQLEEGVTQIPILGTVATFMNPRSGPLAKGLSVASLLPMAFGLGAVLSGSGKALGNLGSVASKLGGLAGEAGEIGSLSGEMDATLGGEANAGLGGETELPRSKGSGPGEVLDDFTGDSNMSDAHADFQSRAGGMARGTGYYVRDPNGNWVQFDGYLNQFLIEAKHFLKNGVFVRGGQKFIADPNSGFGQYWLWERAMPIIEQAQRQIAAAGDVPIVWRVASEEGAEMLRQMFAGLEIDITVEFFQP